MTKEQEAIERLNRIITTKFNNDYSIDSSDKEAIETVLSMLKEKDKEIEKLKKENDLAKEQLKKQCEIIDERNNLLIKVNRLESQIDLMAEEINETNRGYTDYCEMKIECDRNCNDCIKRYFERKSEDGNI